MTQGAERQARRGASGARPGWRWPPVSPIVRFAAVGVAFLLGVYGFTRAYADAGIASTLAQNAFRAVRLIVGNFPQDLENRALPLALHVARWALPLLTFWSTVALAWVQLRTPLRLMMIRARGDHLVIAGDEDGGLAAGAAMAELSGGRRVLLWVRDRRALWVQDAIERGAAEVERDADEPRADRLALDKARAVLLLGRDARANIALGAAAVEQAAAVRPAGDPVDIIVRVDDLDLRRSVEGRFEQGDRKTARTRLVSLPDIAARQLSLDHPIDGFARQEAAGKGKGGRTIITFGFTPTIERFVLRTLAGSHYRDGGKPAFRIHVPDAAEVEAGFRARHPAADSLAPLSFIAGRIDPGFVPALLRAALAEGRDPIAIMVDDADGDRALALALAADGFYQAEGRPAPPLLVRMDGSHDPRLGAGIFAFGNRAAIAGTDLLLQDRHDMLARSVHDFYLESRFAEGERIGARASMWEWEDLPESFRDDNRLVADCYQLKLRDIGARLTATVGPTFALEPDELEELSRAEHDRWMAAKLVQGWTYGPTRDDARRIHPDIVPYDALSEAIRDLDREQVRIMARLLGASGHRALRTLTVALTPGDADLAAAMPAVLALLADHFPDRIPVFLGDFAEPRARAALVALHEADRLIQPALPIHIQMVIDGLPFADQAPARAAYRAADRVHAIGGEADLLALLDGCAVSVGAAARGAERSILLAPDGAVRRTPWTR